jgi:hypothetical protein
LLSETVSPHQWNVERTSAWLNVFRGRIEPPILLARRHLAKFDLAAAARAGEEREP